ncbi:BhlA/UviB family holin-like peptide [Oceanobacillus massiliensis]|uniref:BhlA/UviB family holin-like peptide n=1 Tax=Oceanobacillus massiliensis TaxID=1465765 RepID=UPI000288C040|nr:BhlA/UviB family holin-like peptide [Oceanobacillus massiliensis]
MDLAQIPIDVWLSQGAFAILFVWLLIDSRKDSKQREERLMQHIEKTTDTLDVLSNRMENVNTKVDKIDTRLTEFEKKGV